MHSAAPAMGGMAAARAACRGAAPALRCAAARRARGVAGVAPRSARVSQRRCTSLRPLRAAPEPQRGTLDALDAVLGAPAAPPATPPPPAAPLPASTPAAPRVAPSPPPSADGADGDMWAPFPVPWDWPVLLVAVLGVQGIYFVAATLAPLLVLSSDVDALLSAFPELRDGGAGASGAALSAFLNAPERFWRALLAAELLQTSAGALLLARLLAPYRPFPPGVMALRLRPGDEAAATGDAAAAESRDRNAASVAAAFGAKALPRAPAPPRPPRVEAGPSWALTGAGGAAAAVAAVAGITALSLLLGLRGGEGAASTGFVARAAAGGPPGLASLAVATCVLAPVFEEAVYRGVLLASLTRWMPAQAAVAASAALFAAAHQQGAADSVQLLAMGTIAGIAYCKTRNLATPMLVHALFNASVLGLYAAWVATAPAQ